MKIVQNQKLQKFVEDGLYDDQSPPNISGRIKKHEKQLLVVSKDSIYRYIKSVYGRRIEAYRKKKKARRWKRRAKSKKLKDRTFIDKRPDSINKRRRIGDAEADHPGLCQNHVSLEECAKVLAWAKVLKLKKHPAHDFRQPLTEEVIYLNKEFNESGWRGSKTN